MERKGIYESRVKSPFFSVKLKKKKKILDSNYLKQRRKNTNTILNWEVGIDIYTLPCVK